MIEIDTAAATLDARCLDAPGGFAWWYAEVATPDGDGIVLIWSFGLPFLPGSQRDARAGAGTTPRQRPSLNVVAYRGGQQVCYVLREFEPDDAQWDADASGERWRFGRSTLQARPQLDGSDLLALEASLDLDIAGGGGLRCVLHLEGKRARWAAAPVGKTVDAGVVGAAAGEAMGHRWTPVVGAAFATARLQCGPLRLAVSGRAYHDRNASPRSLEALGIARWLWGRAACADRDRVFYALWPAEAADPVVLGYELGADGTLTAVEDLELRQHAPTRTRWGMPDWQAVDLVRPDGTLFLKLEQRHAVEDGPFYLRRMCDAAAGDTAPNHGTWEVIVPSRIDLDVFRPLVRMRVGREQGENSRWLPLFEGASGDRMRRLLRGSAHVTQGDHRP